jgi:hypothetical protein
MSCWVFVAGGSYKADDFNRQYPHEGQIVVRQTNETDFRGSLFVRFRITMQFVFERKIAGSKSGEGAKRSRGAVGVET